MRAIILLLSILAVISCSINKHKAKSSIDERQPAHANAEIYITDGYFRIDDNSKNEQIKEEYSNNMAFIALISKDDGIIAKPANIEVVFSEEDCMGLSGASLYIDGCLDYIALISGLNRYNKNPMEKTAENMEKVLFPDKPISFAFNNDTYELYATAEVEDDVYNSKNYQLYFKRGAVVQPISYIEQLEHNMPSILFIGDIDNDGYADLLLQEGYNYEYHEMVLYLSSYAREGELVKNVATDEEWRDC